MEKDILLKDLGNRIREIRKGKGMSQKQLAHKIGKDKQSIQRLEVGNVNPSYIYLLEVCRGLEIELKDVLNQTNP